MLADVMIVLADVIIVLADVIVVLISVDQCVVSVDQCWSSVSHVFIIFFEEHYNWIWVHKYSFMSRLCVSVSQKL